MASFKFNIEGGKVFPTSDRAADAGFIGLRGIRHRYFTLARALAEINSLHDEENRRRKIPPARNFSFLSKNGQKERGSKKEEKKPTTNVISLNLLLYNERGTVRPTLYRVLYNVLFNSLPITSLCSSRSREKRVAKF